MYSTWETYDVTVRFTLRAMNADHAADLVEYMLKDMEQYDQLPDWQITSAEPLVEPDAAYHARIEDGETPSSIN